MANLTVTGGSVGINALDSTNSTGLTITNCVVYANNSTGIRIGSTDNNAQVSSNIVYGLPDFSGTTWQAYGISIGGNSSSVYVSGVSISGNTVYNSSNIGIDLTPYTQTCTISNNRTYGDGTGIYANPYSTGAALLSYIKSNVVFDNSYGITTEGNSQATQNTVYGNTTYGIYCDGDGDGILNNTVYNNVVGISSFADNYQLIQGNTVYGNSSYGIEAEGTADNVIGNTTYSNATGIALDYNFSSEVANNVIYGNTNQGILVTNGEAGTYVNNTVYQTTGDAIDITLHDSNVTLRNNILSAQNGFDILVNSTSEGGFHSDFNDLFTTGSGVIGSWEGQSYGTLASWILQLNVDNDSQSVNPQFIQPLGSDGVLGYSTAPASDFAAFSAPAFTTGWTNTPGPDSTAAAASASIGTATATWTISGLTPGAVYQIDTAWITSTAAATDATYSVYDGGAVVDYQRVREYGNTFNLPFTSMLFTPSLTGGQDNLNTKVSANAFSNGDAVVPLYSWPVSTDTTSSLALNLLSAPAVPGVRQIPLYVTAYDNGPAGKGSSTTDETIFQQLGYVTASGTSLTVTLTNNANNSVIAGQVWLQAIVAQGANDGGNFRLAAGSPAVDAGSPSDLIGAEPSPSGGRIDQGAYGGTSQATASPVPEVQVLSPAGLNKLQSGQQFSVTWRTSGIFGAGWILLEHDSRRSSASLLPLGRYRQRRGG